MVMICDYGIVLPTLFSIRGYHDSRMVNDDSMVFN